MKPAMNKVKRIEGVLSPVITPFRKDYSPDEERFVRHCRWLLKSGCAGLAIFGTNSEANSMSVAEKRKLLEALVAGGVPAAALMPGTGHNALSDSVELTREAGSHAAIHADRDYWYVAERGPVAAAEGEVPSNAVKLRGQTLIDLERGRFEDAPTVAQSKQLMRLLIHYSLNGQELATRAILRDLQRLDEDNAESGGAP